MAATQDDYCLSMPPQLVEFVNIFRGVIFNKDVLASTHAKIQNNNNSPSSALAGSFVELSRKWFHALMNLFGVIYVQMHNIKFTNAEVQELNRIFKIYGDCVRNYVNTSNLEFLSELNWENRLLARMLVDAAVRYWKTTDYFDKLQDNPDNPLHLGIKLIQDETGWEMSEYLLSVIRTYNPAVDLEFKDRLFALFY
jgi:hypothetical protein